MPRHIHVIKQHMKILKKLLDAHRIYHQTIAIYQVSLSITCEVLFGNCTELFFYYPSIICSSTQPLFTYGPYTKWREWKHYHKQMEQSIINIFLNSIHFLMNSLQHETYQISLVVSKTGLHQVRLHIFNVLTMQLVLKGIH